MKISKSKTTYSVEKMYKNGLYAEVLAVEPADKMTTTWADVKVKY